MDIHFFNEDVDLPQLNYNQISVWLKEVIESYLKSCGSISVIFCNDDYILNINKQFLDHDYYTDIITFNYSSPKVISGDLFISLDTVKSNSEIYHTEFLHELCRVIVHGILHLLGQDDKTDVQSNEMRKNEDFWLDKLNAYKFN
ncbi:rRNA maturation RNase YbeY [Alkalitalea saponilacus]|uniref:Endoribonuclease YbeY n=1 Tax=Alkalitalea saponilacus TaxID=889453 RepID=A0A1T5EAS9_9BACT|nr:rRNA maturation RNase YbeY [Alkalitalea saponilacus]ASB49062.1 rRNA maturation RNase YbeY [Alkalitalea saponilacus]SKB80795.1 rRNA maturation RNase YbeY [Alkalitalea saponilacus]